MSSSSNEAVALPDLPTRRLLAALGASLGLHLALAAALATMTGGLPLRGAGESETGRATLRARLMPQAEVPAAASQPAARPEWTAVPPMQATGLKEEEPRPPAEAGNPLLPAHYYSTRELDVRPGIMTHVQPEYPESAARRFLSGLVVARLWIDETGAVERIEIVKAEPPGYFEESTRKAFAAARFSPGQKNGRAVRVQMTLEISFDQPPPPTAR